MFLVARGSFVDDQDFAAFVGHCWLYQDDVCRPMLETLAMCGYGLVQIEPAYPEPIDNPPALGYDGDTTTNTYDTEVTDNDMTNRHYYDHDFIQTCNTYGTYRALDQLDNIVDIVDRCNPHHDDPEELYQALQEIRRLALEAIMWGEMTTEDGDDEPSEDDGEGGLFYDGPLDEDKDDDR